MHQVGQRIAPSILFSVRRSIQPPSTESAPQVLRNLYRSPLNVVLNSIGSPVIAITKARLMCGGRWGQIPMHGQFSVISADAPPPPHKKRKKMAKKPSKGYSLGILDGVH